MTTRIEKSIVVNVPLETAYQQWTNFEEFPEFMEGIKEVRQTDPKHVHWVAEIGNKTKEWDAEIVSQDPNAVVAWRSTSGAPNRGTVRFRPLSPHESEVNLVVEYEPEGAAENLASWLGVVSARVEGDMKRFKEFIESRGVQQPTSAPMTRGTPLMGGASTHNVGAVGESEHGAPMQRGEESIPGARAQTVRGPGERGMIGGSGGPQGTLEPGGVRSDPRGPAGKLSSPGVRGTPARQTLGSRRDEEPGRRRSEERDR